MVEKDGKALMNEGGPAVSARRKRSVQSGFTLLELIITLTILALISTGTIPIARNIIKHEREKELKRTLREIRKAIDSYHRDCDAGKIGMLDRKLKDACYPQKLETLVEGVPQFTPGTVNATGEMLRYLRRMPIDPITGRADWLTRSVQDEPDSIGGEENVYDVRSSSQQMSLDGKTYYKDW